MKKYNMNLTKKYEVTFIKDGSVCKKGEKHMVNLPVASKFYKQGLISVTPKMLEDAEALGCKDLFVSEEKERLGNRFIINMIISIITKIRFQHWLKRLKNVIDKRTNS